MSTEHSTPKRLKKERAGGKRPVRLPLIIAAVVIVTVALVAMAFGSGEPAPTAAPVQPTATPTPVPTATPTPEPTPTPTPAPVMDFTQAVPENEPVEMDYFADAVFIGDSRTDGFQLYSGVTGADFLCYNGLMAVQIESKPVIKTASGDKITVPQALAKKQYKKVYISLGINELGFGDTTEYEAAYAKFIDTVTGLQPDAVIYVQTLPPVNPEVGRKYDMAAYITNEKIDSFNEALRRIAESKSVALADVKACLTDENGILPAEYASDGVHMRRSGYQVWLDYLMNHTVDEEAYWNGRAPAAETEESR